MKRWFIVLLTGGFLLVVGEIANYQMRYSPLPLGIAADHILIEKEARRLTIVAKGSAIKTYAIALGREPTGAKQFEGDSRTPEGHFTIDRRKADSSFHLALHISYPRPEDVQFAQSQGRSPGGDIMIHGIRNGLGLLGPIHRVYDWTQGCIAVTNAEIEELWRAVPDGTPVELRP